MEFSGVDRVARYVHLIPQLENMAAIAVVSFLIDGNRY